MLESIFETIEELIDFLFGGDEIQPVLVPVMSHNEPKRIKTHLDIGPKLKIENKAFAEDGARDAIIASSGKGKSYLLGKLMEEMLEAGSTLFVIDPEGEHYSLGMAYDVLVFGGERQKGEQADRLELKFENIKAIVAKVLTYGISAVFDLSQFDSEDEQRAWFSALASELFYQQTLVEPHNRILITLVVEEAAIFAPQNAKATISEKIPVTESSLTVARRYSNRGRKRGLNSVFATQRPAGFNNDILAQCNRKWWGGIDDFADFSPIEKQTKKHKLTFDTLNALKPGDFYFCARGSATRFRASERKCPHIGKTPEPKLEKRSFSAEELKKIRGANA